MQEQLYSKKYYQQIEEGSQSSAKQVIPMVLSFVQPQSVLDVGCGTGTWLAEWKNAGIDDFIGVDGYYLKNEQLLIPKEKFVAADLEKPLQINRKFELVTSLEVAEHIRPQYAEAFIAALCQYGDIILFSAAIPGQGGVNHFNEQYPDYWAHLFSRQGFTGYDCLRPKIWLNRKIDTCYRQNLLFFLKDEVKSKYPSITKYEGPLLSLVHPEHFQKKEEILVSYQNVLRTPFHVAWHFLKKFWQLFKGKRI